MQSLKCLVTHTGYWCRLLRLSMENKLDLAHLSWCSGLDSQSDHMIYMQILPVMILRYGTYIDVAAPIFSWTFFQEVALQTLEEAQTGLQTTCS